MSIQHDIKLRKYHFEVFGTSGCSYTKKALKLLVENVQPHIFFDTTNDINNKELKNRTYNLDLTYPQIFYNNIRIGGYDELNKLKEKGYL